VIIDHHTGGCVPAQQHVLRDFLQIHVAGLLAAKGIPHELDLWGYDVPHDWPSWRRQFAHHLPRFC